MIESLKMTDRECVILRLNSKTISVNVKPQSRGLTLLLLTGRLSIGLLPVLAAGCASIAEIRMENNYAHFILEINEPVPVLADIPNTTPLSFTTANMPPTLSLSRSFFNTVPYQPVILQTNTEAGRYDDLNADNISTTISAEYNLSYLNFSTRSKDAQSILTWRDMYLHSGKINGEIGLDTDIFNRIHVGAEFAQSFNGNWIDDDSNNALRYVGVTDSSVTALGFDFALGNESGYLVKKVGLNLISLSFKNYNYRHFAQSNGPFYSDISGNVSTYDQAMIRLYADVKNRLVDTSFFYADLGGRAGLTLGIGKANWLLRGDLEHPVSFRTTGLFFHAGGSAELGFKIKMFTVYLGIDIDYEISPWLSLDETFYANGHTYKQGLFQELSRASVNASVRVRF
jgi:hypothetical protein